MRRAMHFNSMLSIALSSKGLEPEAHTAGAPFSQHALQSITDSGRTVVFVEKNTHLNQPCNNSLQLIAFPPHAAGPKPEHLVQLISLD